MGISTATHEAKYGQSYTRPGRPLGKAARRSRWAKRHAVNNWAAANTS
jgi:hypothetical protein